MAVSIIDSFGLLNRWPRLMTERLYPFNQADDHFATTFPAVYIQTERDMLASALREAFFESAHWLGFYPKPIYRTEFLRMDTETDWRGQEMLLDTSHVVDFGERLATREGASAWVVEYSDEDEDDKVETATIAVTGVATTTTAASLRAFFTVADGAPAAADKRYEVPIKSATKSGTTITLVMDRADCVRPSFASQYPYLDADPNNRRSADALKSDDFAVSLDVYAITTDTTNGATLQMHPGAGETAVTTLVVAPVLLDGLDGRFVLRPSAATNAQPSTAPYGVIVKFKAGYELASDGNMQSSLEQAVLRLANANIMHNFASFSNIVRERYLRDDKDLWHNQFIPDEYKNPLGIKRGHLEAWVTLSRFADRVTGRASSWAAQYA